MPTTPIASPDNANRATEGSTELLLSCLGLGIPDDQKRGRKDANEDFAKVLQIHRKPERGVKQRPQPQYSAGTDDHVARFLALLGEVFECGQI